MVISKQSNRSIKILLFILLMLTGLEQGCTPTCRQMQAKRLAQSEIDYNWLHWGFDDTPLSLTLEDAVQIALFRNLDLAVAEVQYDLQQEVSTRAKLNMLPKLIVDTDDAHRDRPVAAFSQSLVPNIPPAPPSISSGKLINRYNIDFFWSLLDFGVSFFRYRQEQDKTYIQALEYKRQMQNLIQKVVKSYWLSAGEQIFYEKYRAMRGRLEEIKNSIQRNIKEGRISLLEGSSKLDIILTTQEDLEDYTRDYVQDIAEFKALLGIPPETVIDFIAPEPEEQSALCFDIEDLEQAALYYRPELYSNDMKDLIWRDEVYIALLQFFPDISPYILSSYDGDRFLINNKWTTIGLKSTWNLLSIPQHIQDRTIAAQQIEVNTYNRLLLSFSIISQVRLSVFNYDTDLERFRVYNQLWKTRENYLNVLAKEYELGGIAELQLLITTLAELDSEFKARRAWSDLQSSFELINNSIGLPFYMTQHLEEDQS